MIYLENTTLNNPVRRIKAKVELYNSSTLVDTFYYTDALKSFDIQRVGNEGKFFGFVITQRLNIKLRDINRELDITTANSFKVFFADGDNDYICTAPKFYVTEVNRDENTNELSITAYDALKDADKHTFSEVGVISGNLTDVVSSMAAALDGVANAAIVEGDIYKNITNLSEDSVNLEGTEKLSDVLAAAAEALGAVMFLKPIGNEDTLVIKGVANAAVALRITKQDYITLDTKTNRKLTSIAVTTQLGENYSATTGEIGTTQYIRDNPFLELQEYVNYMVDGLRDLLGGLTVNQFNCSWRGNYCLEIGDKIELIGKDNKSYYSYVFNDKIEYNGTLAQTTSWTYSDNEAETATNPTNIGDAIKQTYAIVDKVEKQINIVASESDANSAAIAAIQLNTDSISATVSELQTTTKGALDNATEDIANLKSSVEAQITATDITLLVKEEINNGVTKVETTTGVTVDDRGLTVNKSTSEMETTISEDGMKIYKNEEAVLTADNSGVNARNLHATTYLIIGGNSRFENYGSNRTGCFWIGGNS